MNDEMTKILFDVLMLMQRLLQQVRGVTRLLTNDCHAPTANRHILEGVSRWLTLGAPLAT